MLHLTDLSGLVSVASAMTAMLLLVPRPTSLPRHRLAIWLTGCFIMMLIPLNGLPIAGYIRGATGDLSITTQILLWSAMLRPWLPDHLIATKAHRALLVLIAISAALLYPMALGFSMSDPYRLGYGEPFFITALLILASLAWLHRSFLIPLCISLATLAWSIGWLESDNLWDYLLDPFVAIYALSALLIGSVKRRESDSA